MDQERTQGASAGEMFLFVVGALGAIAVMVMYLLPSFIHPHRRSGQLTACKSNLKNLGTALEMYDVDYGVYPDDLSRLTPAYLRQLPECPQAMSDTYTASYAHFQVNGIPQTWCPDHGRDGPCANYVTRMMREVSEFYVREQRWPHTVADLQLPKNLVECPYGGARLGYTQVLGGYEVYCGGPNHLNVKVPADYPRYNGYEGLIER